MASYKELRRQKIRKRIRPNVLGTAQRPRLSVFRSNKEIYAQLVDDVSGNILASSTSRAKDITELKSNKVEKSKLVGKVLGEKALKLGIEKVAFDRGGYLYHGRVKSLAEGAREAGLKF